jgi:hypothetical protein
VAMSAIQTPQAKQSRLRTGGAFMTLAGLAFVAYAAVFPGAQLHGHLPRVWVSAPMKWTRGVGGRGVQPAAVSLHLGTRFFALARVRIMYESAPSYVLSASACNGPIRPPNTVGVRSGDTSFSRLVGCSADTHMMKANELRWPSGAASHAAIPEALRPPGA